MNTSNSENFFGIKPIQLELVARHTKDSEMRIGDAVKDFIRNHPDKFLISILPWIHRETQFHEIIFTTSDKEYRHSNRVQVEASCKIRGYTRILDISFWNCGLYDSSCIKEIKKGRLIIKSKREDDFKLDSQYFDVDLEVKDKNYIIDDFNLYGTYESSKINISELDIHDVAGEFDVTGVLDSEYTPDWIICLVDSILSYKRGEVRGTILNLFASLEQVVNIMYESDEKNKGKLSEKWKDIKFKIDKVGNKLGLNIQKLPSFKRWKEYKKLRNCVAHGKQFEEQDIDLGEMYLDILTLMFSLFNRSDIDAVGWGILTDMNEEYVDECEPT